MTNTYIYTKRTHIHTYTQRQTDRQTVKQTNKCTRVRKYVVSILTIEIINWNLCCGSLEDNVVFITIHIIYAMGRV